VYQRAVREELSEEEFALFDLLTKPDIKLTRKQEIEVKISRDLLDNLASSRPSARRMLSLRSQTADSP